MNGPRQAGLDWRPYFSWSWKEMVQVGTGGLAKLRNENRSLNTGLASEGMVRVLYSELPIFTRAYGELRSTVAGGHSQSQSQSRSHSACKQRSREGW